MDPEVSHFSICVMVKKRLDFEEEAQLDPLGNLLGRKKKRANSGDEPDERMGSPVLPPTQPTSVSPDANDNTTVDNETQTDDQDGGGGMPRGLNFTKIIVHKPDPTPFTETRTAEHKLVTYCSVNQVGKTIYDGTKTTGFSIRLNDPTTTFLTFGDMIEQAINSTNAKGVSATMAPPDDNHPGNLLEFPRTMRNANGGLNGQPKTRMSWIEWYRKQYKYYHVCSTEVKITITHAHKSVTKGSGDLSWGNSDRTVAVAYWRDSLSGEAADNTPFSTTAIPSETNGQTDTTYYGIANYEKFRGIKWKYVTNPLAGSSMHNGGHTQVITHKWTDKDPSKNIKNLDSQKQWYPTGATPSSTWSPTPAMAEEFRLGFIRGPNATGAGSVNCKIEITQIVQWKDLRPDLRYVDQPTHGNFSIHLRPGIDDVQYPYPSNSIRKKDYMPDVPTYPTTA